MLGKFGCPKCNGTGIVIGDFDIERECDCVKELELERLEEDKEESAEGNMVEAPNLFGELSMNDKILKMKLVPAHRIEDSFDENHVKIVALQMCGLLKCRVKAESINRYIGVLSSILTGLRSRRLPDHSYIIGASNGFGKTTFVNTAIKILASNGMKAVPYISLTELAEKWVEYTKSLAKCLDDTRRNLRTVTEPDEDDEYNVKDEYDWKDYIEADLVFTYLTSTNEDVMWIEMQVLKHLIELRGNKGRATIVMTRESLEWYRHSEKVKKYIYDSIIEAQATDDSREKMEFGKNEMACNLKERRYDKLEHISTYLIPLKE